MRAEHSGFCFGVKRAVIKAEESIAFGDGKRIFTCGQLIHNERVTEDLRKRGVSIIDDINEASQGDILIVRSHGEPKSFYDRAADIGVNIVDTTCPFVSKIHTIVNEAYEKGREIIIVGNPEHQEVKATNGWCGYSAHIVKDEYDAKALASNFDLKNRGEALVVCQTTIRRELLDGVLKEFDKCGLLYNVKNTICNATRDRQESCAKLAKDVDAMVVIGDPNSSNSGKLFEIARKYCKNTYFIKGIADLPLKEMQKYNKIGLSSGASTPEVTIKEVISGMNEEVNKMEEQNSELSMVDFMDEIDKSLKLPRSGDIVNGTVIEVGDDKVIVNLGVKKDGILPIEEVAIKDGETLADIFHEGDEVEAKVLKSSDGDGGILLSKKKLEMNENWKELNEALEDKSTIHIKLVRAVNGGVIAAYKEISGFVPMSQLSDRYVEKADPLIGKDVDVKVIRVDNRRNRAVFSRKQVLLEEKRQQVEKIWDSLNVGDIVEGKVMRFTDYGAFVDIGGVDGLLHISEISWGKLKHPQEILSIGEIINVKILSLNREKGKISLGLKQTTPEPWTLVGTKYQVGQIVKGKVVQIKEYGAFVELEAGLDGLVHISEIANKRVENVSDEVSVGQEISAKIMEIDNERRRISLSIKAALREMENEEPELEDSESEREIESAAPDEAPEADNEPIEASDKDEYVADKDSGDEA